MESADDQGGWIRLPNSSEHPAQQDKSGEGADADRAQGHRPASVPGLGQVGDDDLAQLGGERPDVDDVYLLAVDALAQGQSYEKAGRPIERSARSVRRRMSDPDFAGLVKDRRLEMVSVGTGRLNAAVELATETIIAALESAKVADRLQAARLILDQGSRLTSRAEYEALIRELEHRLAAGTQESER